MEGGIVRRQAEKHNAHTNTYTNKKTNNKKHTLFLRIISRISQECHRGDSNRLKNINQCALFLHS